MMEELKYELLAEVYGRMEAELIKSYLEANGIDVELFQESIGQNIYPTTVDQMGRVQIFVEKVKMDEALSLMDELKK
ncbi:MAG: DUF2007 domain-containing protein [Saprospiraceae bacterium]|nr:DUF2007 domain-containing protein [Saprospiraceae bacterium]